MYVLFLLVYAGVPCLASFAIAYALGFRLRGMRPLVFMLSPIVIPVLLWFSYHSIWNPDGAGCTEECYGRALYFLLGIGMTIAAELGALGGWLHADWREPPSTY